MNETLGKFYGVGTGPGDPSLLTLKAVEVFKTVDIIYAVTGSNSQKSVSASVVNSIEECPAELIELTFTMAKEMCDRESAWKEHAETIVKQLRAGKSCAFATIGDPLFYSTYTYLLREIQALEPELEVETIPGITSFQAAASKANLPMVEDKETLALVPAWTEGHLTHPALHSADTIIMLKAFKQRDLILTALKNHGMEGRTLYAARLGLDGEVLTENMDEMKKQPTEYLSMLIAKRK